jgi:tetratricopeptide (TPR) repeat protein
LALRVDESRLRRTRSAPAASLGAYDLWLRGKEHLVRGTLEDDLAAREYFTKALEIDPHYPRAHAGLSLSYYNDWSCQNWHIWKESETEAFEAARRAVELEPRDPVVHVVLGRIHLYRREWEPARSHYDQALSLNPVDPEVISHIALGMGFLGECERAIQLADRAIALHPAHHPWYFGCKGLPLFTQGDYQSAARLFRQGDHAFLDFPAFEAAAFAYLGEIDEAHRSRDAFLANYRTKIRFGGEFSTDEPLLWLAQVNPFREKSHAEHFLEGLHRAGLGELPPGHRPFKPDVEVRPAGLRADINKFVKEGDLWSVAFAGEGARLVGVKGFEDISRLLARPGQPLHSIELMGSTSSFSSADSTLDAEARESLEHRVRELQEDIAEGERANDPGRTERASRELSEIAAELSRSLGLGGRSRKLGDPAERARSAVTWRIRSAIKKLRAAHPGLGQHLAATMRTGTFCVYEPGERIEWKL